MCFKTLLCRYILNGNIIVFFSEAGDEYVCLHLFLHVQAFLPSPGCPGAPGQNSALYWKLGVLAPEVLTDTVTEPRDSVAPQLRDTQLQTN